MHSGLSGLVDNLSEIKDKCLDEKSISELIKKFPNTFRFCNGDHYKFVMLLRKGAYPHKYMDSWERFNETSVPSKKYFYYELNLEGISDKDYDMHEKYLKNIVKPWVTIMIYMFKQIYFYLLMFSKF